MAPAYRGRCQAFRHQFERDHLKTEHLLTMSSSPTVMALNKENLEMNSGDGHSSRRCRSKMTTKRVTAVYGNS